MARRRRTLPVKATPVAAPAVVSDGTCGRHGGLLKLLRRIRRTQVADRHALGHDLEMLGQDIGDLVEEMRAVKVEATAAKAEGARAHGRMDRAVRDGAVAIAVALATLGSVGGALAYYLEPPAVVVAGARIILGRHASAHPTAPSSAPGRTP